MKKLKRLRSKRVIATRSYNEMDYRDVSTKSSASITSSPVRDEEEENGIEQSQQAIESALTALRLAQGAVKEEAETLNDKSSLLSASARTWKWMIVSCLAASYYCCQSFESFLGGDVKFWVQLITCLAAFVSLSGMHGKAVVGLQVAHSSVERTSNTITSCLEKLNDHLEELDRSRTIYPATPIQYPQLRTMIPISPSFRIDRSGYLSTLNDQQENELNKLEELMENSIFLTTLNAQPDKKELQLRFLRATMKDKKTDRVFQADIAKSRLEKYLEFETKWKPKVESDRWPKFRQVRRAHWWIDSTTQTVVMAEKFGRFASGVDPKLFTSTEWAQCTACMTEKLMSDMRECTKLYGKDEPRGVYCILDMKGFTLRGFTVRIGLVKTLSTLVSELYPESVGKVCLVNSPWIIHKAFNIAKTFLDEDTVNKVEIYQDIPKNFHTWFDTDKLPKQFGGTSDVVLREPLKLKKYTRQRSSPARLR